MPDNSEKRSSYKVKRIRKSVKDRAGLLKSRVVRGLSNFSGAMHSDDCPSVESMPNRVHDSDRDASNSSSFICGVVEGFYGRPWTSEQRKKLFKRMNTMGMNTYIYAPKDDSKHRMYWRDLYTVEEAEMLTALVEAAEENGVTFVYALSPGLDMTYSSSKEVSSLKRKLSQVSSFGCKAFALLFDDIETDMCEADKAFFQSFAFAQVSVTNEVYQHLHEPAKFFFCPTEYCASRAIPSVTQSEYLQTVGSKLLKGIDVMWTGPKVISKRISIKSIEELTSVLKRPPLIWDNIHANDYDQKRIFLGPYDGRSPELIPYLRGVLTNPNCEFESNFIALHTLAQWSRSNAGGVKKDCILSASPVNSADIKLETDGEYTVDEDIPAVSTLPHSYLPKHALQLALIDWHNELFDKCSAPRRLNSTQSVYPAFNFAPILPPIDSKAVIAPVSSSEPIPVPTLKTNLDPMAVLEMTDTYVKPPSVLVPHNALIDHQSSSSSSPTSYDLDMNCPVTVTTEPVAPGAEPMDYAPTSSIISSSDEGVAGCGSTGVSSSPPPLDEGSALMLVDQQQQNDDDVQLDDDDEIECDEVAESGVVDVIKETTVESFNLSDVSLITDLFYLPFEHGRWSIESLTEFHWLKTNCPTAGVSSESGAPSDEWVERSKAFVARLTAACGVIDKLTQIPNKALLYELFPYVWDIKAVLLLMNCFVQWLGQCKVKCSAQSCLLGGPYSWGNRGYGDYTMSGEREPWLFRGGVLGEFQRMLPFEYCTDLLFYTIPDSPHTTMFTVRPYTSADMESVYRVCLQTCNDGADGTSLCPNHPQLIPDRYIGAYLQHSPDMCFVIEDREGVCGYVMACTNARSFYDSYRNTWIPIMINKYQKPTSEGFLPSLADELLEEFHLYSSSSDIAHGSSSCEATDESSAAARSSCRIAASGLCTPPGESLLLRHPSIVRVDMLRSRLVLDITAPVRALACAVAALKVAGSCGIFTRLSVGDCCMAEFYRRLGFFEIPHEQVESPAKSLSSSSSSTAVSTEQQLADKSQPAMAADATNSSSEPTRTTNTTSEFIHMGRII